jgi:hypothetical protein
MGILKAVGRALGVSKVTVSRSGIGCSGTATEVIPPLIVAISALGPRETRRVSTEQYFEGVITKERLGEFTALLEEAFGAPAKPFGSRGDFEGDLEALVDSRGGIDKGQCLYIRSYEDDGRVAFAALWPWSDGHSITLKVGIYARAG